MTLRWTEEQFAAHRAGKRDEFWEKTQSRPKPVARAERSVLEVRMELQLNAVPDKFEVEYPFHPARKWRFDFACLSKMVAIEVEGGIWAEGRHTRASGFLKDMEKYNCAQIMGWKVIRVAEPTIKDGSGLREVERALGYD